MKPPAFQFYADDFLAGTITMTNEERGLYITLLCRQWSQGFVSRDDIARLCLAMAQPSVDHVLAKFKQGKDDLLRNERMESEREKQASFRANRSESGKLGADKRWHSHSTAIAQPMAKHSSPSPSPSPSFVNIGFVALKVANRIISNQDSWSYDNCKVDVNKLKSKPLASVIEPHAGKLTENQIIKAWIDAVFVAHGAQVDGLANNATAYCVTVFKEKLKQ